MLALQACPFRVEVFAQDCNVDLKAMELGDHKKVLNNSLLEVVRGKGEKRKVAGVKNVNLLTYETKLRCSVAIENKVRNILLQNSKLRHFYIIISYFFSPATA